MTSKTSIPNMSITKDQAKEVTRELIRSSISTIMYERFLLPRSCFERKVYPMAGYKLTSQDHPNDPVKEVDRMLSNFKNIINEFHREELGLVKFVIAGTIKEGNSPDTTKHAIEIYSIDLRNRLSFARNNDKERIIKENAISFAEVHRQLLVTIRELSDHVKLVQPLETIDKYYAITGPPFFFGRHPGAKDNLMFAPYGRWADEIKGEISSAGLMAINQFLACQGFRENDSIKIEEKELRTVNTLYYMQPIFIRRIITSSPISPEAFSKGLPVRYYEV